MKRKLLYLLIPLIPILIGIFFAVYYSIPRLEFEYNSLYEGYFVSYAYGDLEEYTIPKEYKGAKVKGFSIRAFFSHKALKRIIIEDELSIEYVGRLAFSECDNLNEISIKYAKEIGKNAFAFDVSLKKIELSAPLIGGAAFYGCEALESVTLEPGIISLGSYSFSGCKTLKTLTIPDTIIDIYTGCFNSSGLEEFFVPSHIKNNAYIQSLDYVKYY
jgi:hypothetical protein